MKTLENTSNYKRDLNGAISCTFEDSKLGTIPNGLNTALDAELIAEIEKAGLVEEPSKTEKDAHTAQQTNETIKQELAALDAPIRTVIEYAMGNEEAIRVVNELEAKKVKLRAKLIK